MRKWEGMGPMITGKFTSVLGDFAPNVIVAGGSERAGQRRADSFDSDGTSSLCRTIRHDRQPQQPPSYLTGKGGSMVRKVIRSTCSTKR